jgi:Raf kinase inhibitor-like YbhB/YbcL family protein
MSRHSSGEAITIQRVLPREPGRLALASEAIGEDGRIEDGYSAYGDDRSPALQWTAMPDAESFVLIVEDPDAPLDKPVLHWAIWNIPGTFDALPSGIRNAPVVDEFGGMAQGKNQHGQNGYMGPRPPADDGPHRYHFQLFALDRRLGLQPGAPLEALVNELKGSTIASAELVGTYECVQDLAAPVAGEGRVFGDGHGRGGLDEDDVDRHAPHDDEGVVRPEA